MKICKKIAVLISIVVFSSSFSMPGGEGFEVYLNNSLVTRQYGQQMDQINSFSLAKAQPADKLVIRYYHCGRAGKNRTLLITKETGKTIKTFRYPDTSTNSSMELPLNDVVNRQYPMKLFYISDQLPKGRLLLELNKAGSIAIY
jgi:hypothetical protein